MNIKTYLLCGTAALTLASCGGNAKKQTAESVIRTDTLSVRGDSVYTLALQVGDVQAMWIRDNAADRLMPRTLFPDAPDALVDSLGLAGGVPSTVSTFYVKTPDAGILFDTGLGATDSRLLSGLQTFGVAPADVKYIYLTHMHGDHIGGMLTAEGAVVFPNAEVYVSKPEYDYWMADKANRQQVKTMEAYQDRLHLFQFGDTLPGKVVAMDAVGHTPGHAVFQVGRLLVVGDIMHGAALQKVHPEVCATFDMDKEAAIRVRRHFIHYAQENGLTMAGMHLPVPAFD